MIIEDILKKEPEFKYMLLSRLEQDCKYFLGCGNRRDKHLWANNPAEHIKYMKAIYNNLKEKPEWLSLKDIESYSSQMQPSEA